jgi:TetR/AcrR family transcriptional regulator, mexJK operon transcriptional repressor
MDKEPQADTLPSSKPAGRPRASDIEARARNLICTAGALFLKHGYTKVSLEAIAREAHVAVRTIYVKFGGKAGLFNAVLETNRDRFFDMHGMETDPRPIKSIVDDFSRRFLDLVMEPAALSMQRMVIAEAASNPELAQTYFDAGPKQMREMLARFFARPDIRAQLRDDVPLALLPVHLLNCVMGDHISRYLFQPSPEPREDVARSLDARLSLFYRSVLREP